MDARARHITQMRASGPGPINWPEGLRVIAQRKRPHLGAQLRLTDHNGWRITCFATNTCGLGWRLRALEVRIRCLKDIGLANLPLYGFGQNRIWVEIVALVDLLAWMRTLAFDGSSLTRRWEPKRLRFRLFALAGRTIRTGCRRLLRLPS